MSVTVDPTDGLGQTELLRRLERVADEAAALMYPGQDIALRQINQSENTTYIVEPSDATQSVLRIHRTGYHSDAAIRSEHAWLEALRNESGVRTPAVLANPAGETITKVSTAELPEGRSCVFFEFLQGQEPAAEELHENFPALGEVTAKMHEHVLNWRLPDGFERFHWNLETIFGSSPHWGHWYDCPSINSSSNRVLERLVNTLQTRLQTFGMSRDRFGLVHADMRLANLLIHDDEARVIDFDDSGFSWFLYDLATAVSFIEDRSDVMELVDAWLEGYRRIRTLSAEEVREIPTFMMLRRMLIVAWIGSHSETDLAAELGPDFAEATCELADDYLSKMG